MLVPPVELMVPARVNVPLPFLLIEPAPVTVPKTTMLPFPVMETLLAASETGPPMVRVPAAPMVAFSLNATGPFHDALPAGTLIAPFPVGPAPAILSGSVAIVRLGASVISPPLVTLVAPVSAPRASGERTSRVPAVTLMAPVVELVHVRLSFPVPTFTTVPVPVKSPSKVVLLEFPTVSVPAPRATVPELVTAATV